MGKRKVYEWQTGGQIDRVEESEKQKWKKIKNRQVNIYIIDNIILYKL